MTSAQAVDTLRSLQAGEWILSDDLVHAVAHTLERCEHDGLPMPLSVEVVDESLWVYDPSLPKGKFPASVALNYFGNEPTLGDQRIRISHYPPGVFVERRTKRLWRLTWEEADRLENPGLFEAQGQLLTEFVVRVVSQFGLTG
jgi:hypothetical protein